MADLHNLTERISHLRDREGGSAILNGTSGDSHKKVLILWIDLF